MLSNIARTAAGLRVVAGSMPHHRAEPEKPKRQATGICSREESNLHGFPHTVLSRTRLPFRHVSARLLRCPPEVEAQVQTPPQGRRVSPMPGAAFAPVPRVDAPASLSQARGANRRSSTPPP